VARASSACIPCRAGTTGSSAGATIPGGTGKRLSVAKWRISSTASRVVVLQAPIVLDIERRDAERHGRA
jgi:hypothetical protein